nr:hypothetical protein [Ensifer aridi]
MIDWCELTEEDAIDAAMDEHGTPRHLWLICALQSYRGVDTPEYRFWLGLFLKLAKCEHVGWA